MVADLQLGTTIPVCNAILNITHYPYFSPRLNPACRVPNHCCNEVAVCVKKYLFRVMQHTQSFQLPFSGLITSRHRAGACFLCISL